MTKNKQTITLKYNRRPVVIKGRYYPSMHAAARKLKTNYSAVYFAVAGKQPPHKRLCKPGWRYATDSEIRRYEK